jgi:hypothetical protein
MLPNDEGVCETTPIISHVEREYQLTHDLKNTIASASPKRLAGQQISTAVAYIK